MPAGRTSGDTTEAPEQPGPSPIARPGWWDFELPPVEGNPPPIPPAGVGGLWNVSTAPERSVPVAAQSALPTDSIGERTGRRHTLWIVGIIAALVGAAIGGLVGGIVGSVNTDSKTTEVSVPTNPSFTLPVSEPSIPTAVAPGSVEAIAAAVLPSVVTVHIRDSNELGTGSGVVLSSDGYILTNNHVVAINANATGVLTVDLDPAHTNIPAKIVGRSPLDDLAVIKVSASNLAAARIGRSANLRVGQVVVAVGSPLGLSGSVTSGIVSALARNIEVPSDFSSATTVLGNAIQTDAAINPGNSGGALVDATGAVVGINSAIATASNSDSQSGSIGVGFAIPIDYASRIAQEIIRTGKASHAFLGIVPRSIDPSDVQGNGPVTGAYVTRVDSGSPAAAAGLRSGDVITEFAGQLITDADDLVGATRARSIGDVVAIRYVRDGRTVTTTATLIRSPQD